MAPQTSGERRPLERLSEPRTAVDSAILLVALVAFGLLMALGTWLFFASMELFGAAVVLIVGVPFTLWMRTGSPFGDLHRR